jgi:predicted small lipoprotein YifL
MVRALLLLVALVAVGCGTKSTTTFSAAEVQAPPATARDVDQDDYESNYVKQSEEQNREKDEAVQQQFRQLPAAEQKAIAEVRDLIQERPAADLTEA